MIFPRLRLACVWLALLASAVAAPKEIVVCQYNVRNYVNASPAGAGQRAPTKAKSEAEIAALIHIIREISPDILGICEMGTPDRFADFQARLAEAGLGYVDMEYVQAADEDRHLALLSRFPIVARQSATDVPFVIDGKPQKVRRGFLDVTVQVNANYQLRLVGAHLKSRLAINEGEAVVRRYEAEALRKHLDKILAAEPAVNLLCYGDFNETRNTPVLQEICGVRGTPNYLAELLAKDSLGDRWTHYWEVADEYSRIDYLLASSGLTGEVLKPKTVVYRGPDWAVASDHRAVYTSILPVNRP